MSNSPKPQGEAVIRWRTDMRRRLSEAQNHRCCYCGARMTELRDKKSGVHSPTTVTIEHLTPKVRGGSNDWENLVAACSACNSARGDMPAIAFYYMIQVQRGSVVGSGRQQRKAAKVAQPVASPRPVPGSPEDLAARTRWIEAANAKATATFKRAYIPAQEPPRREAPAPLIRFNGPKKVILQEPEITDAERLRRAAEKFSKGTKPRERGAPITKDYTREVGKYPLLAEALQNAGLA